MRLYDVVPGRQLLGKRFLGRVDEQRAPDAQGGERDRLPAHREQGDVPLQD